METLVWTAVGVLLCCNDVRYLVSMERKSVRMWSGLKMCVDA